MLDFYKGLYEAEWTRKDGIQSSVSLSFGVLVLVVAGLTYLTRESGITLGEYPVYWAALLGGVASALVCAYQLVRAQVGYTYRRLAYPTALLHLQNDLDVYYTANGSKLPATAKSTAREQFESDLVQRLAEATDRNTKNNVQRGEHLHRANLALVAALVFNGLAFIPTVWHSFSSSEVQMAENENSPQTTAPAPQNTAPAEPPPMPSVPQNMDQKSDVKPIKIR